MAHVLNDRVYETTTTTGIGTIDLGGAVTGYQGFVAGIGDGNTTDFVIEDPATGDWEVGRGTVTDGSPDTLSRTTIHGSSNAGSKVDFAAGTKNVYCSMPASKLVTVDNASETIDDRVSSLVQNGTALSWTYNDGAGTLTGNVQLGTGATDAAAGNHNHTGVYQPAGTYYSPSGTDVALADGGTGASLVDPGKDSILFWDDSVGTVAWLTVSSPFSIGGTFGDELIIGIGTGANQVAAGNHTHTGVYQPAGTYYSPGGTDVALADGGTGASLTDPNADRILFWDDSAGAVTWLTAGTGLSITDTTIACSITQYTDALAVAAIKADAAWHATNWDTAYGWGNHASAGYLTSQTSHADVVVDGDFASQGIMLRGASSGSYSILADNSANWNTAYGWGNHASAGYYASGGTDVALADGGTGASLSDPNADRILFWDDSAGAMTWLACGNSVSITTTTLDTAQDIRTSATPTFVGIIASKSAAGAVITTIKAETVNSSSGETHASTFSSQDNNSGTVRALFCCAGPLNSGTADQGYFDFLNEAGTMYIGRFKSLAADNGATLSLYDRASPQVVKVHLHTAGVSYVNGGALVVGQTTAGDSADFYVKGKISTSGEVEINGDLNHDGTNVGFFGVAPTTRPTAYTQTYSTASKTVPNATASNPPAGGTGATAGAYDTAAHRDSMITSLTNVITDVDNLRKVVTSIIDDLQALGLLQ